MPDTTEATETPGWDRRRFIKASAGGAALVWAAPTITGLNARAFAAGSDPDCVLFFTNFDEGSLGLSQTGVVVPGLTVTGGNVDIIGTKGSASSFDLIPGNGLYMDLDGTQPYVGQPEVQVNDLGVGTFTIQLVVAGSRRGPVSSAQVSYGLVPLETILLSSSDGPTIKTYTGVIATVGAKLTISQIDSPDNQGLLVLSIKVSNC